MEIKLISRSKLFVTSSEVEMKLTCFRTSTPLSVTARTDTTAN